ncbi:dephospho-CoA kinase [Curtobacterium citreum]|uniref:Dephospho-CoA kinase n=1 Tax=Curtobacterium citreum TaxID=2036 RepID=A0ABT2HDG5_9MICO|nr:dephospho-CoA kinase [Curtobacterium citreum]MCS6521301.1 dephospho-CoA kinase [Curtobacterium citreum]MDK8172808.1 dephospho-CoA kinase [Curtobacterium citreum]TQJ28158.1 dephospho-CoA kinase [Curtobacterium citreum]WIJ43893.1 dephospho-CoA kinase [Curtobacterium citreum]GGL68995.1 dephospho-CoA kinase [Curtobacterium citreum]
MRIIGLTGGIAAGKSTVSRRWAEHGAVVVDADRLARDAVAPESPGLAQVAERFGPGVIAADGSLDRPALGAVVFADPVARRDLEAITHPEVWRLAQQAFDAAEAADPDAVVVYDVPLLAEARGSRPLRFDAVVVVDAPAAQRIERLVAHRGMARDEAERRVASQASDAERLALADHVVDATGTLEATIRSADAVWEQLTH